MEKSTQKTPPGPPAELLSHIEHLARLLLHLPSEIPEAGKGRDPQYQFYFDSEDVNEEGLYYAFNRRLEICFKTTHAGNAGNPIWFLDSRVWGTFEGNHHNDEEGGEGMMI